MSENTEASREPTLEDIRDNLLRVFRLVQTVNGSIDHVHVILDKELYAEHDPTRDPEKVVSAEMPNLRFDMFRTAKDSILGLEGCIKNLESLKMKMRNPTTKKG